MLLLLLACHIDSDFTCESEVREVADDEVLGELGFTVADLVADVAGTRTVTMSYMEGDDPTDVTTDATLGITRGEEPAVFADVEMVESTSLQPGLYSDHNLIAVHCESSVRVPLDVSFATADEEVVVAGVAELAAYPGRAAEALDSWLMGTYDAEGVLVPEATGTSDGTLEGRFLGPELAWLEVTEDGDPLLAYEAPHGGGP